MKRKGKFVDAGKCSVGYKNENAAGRCSFRVVEEFRNRPCFRKVLSASWSLFARRLLRCWWDHVLWRSVLNASNLLNRSV
jgi:hypothetical protein